MAELNTIKKDVKQFFKKNKCLINYKNQKTNKVIYFIVGFITDLCNKPDFDLKIGGAVGDIKFDYMITTRDNSYLFFIGYDNKKDSNIFNNEQLKKYKTIYIEVKENKPISVYRGRNDDTII